MSNNTFYGTENSSTITYLEFGEIDIAQGNKKVWDFRLHQKAYDWLMLGRYANDLAAYVEMDRHLAQDSLEAVFDLYNTEVHHPNDFATNFDKLVALSLIQQKQENVSFFELGQTIFGCIEGIVFCQNLLNRFKIPFRQIDIKATDWHGVDISELFNFLAAKLHQDLRIHTSTELAEGPKTSDIFFSKGITLLYAVKEIDELFELIAGSQLAIFDYSLTLGPPEVTTIGSGKSTNYLNFDEFIHTYQQNGKKLYVRKKISKLDPENNRIWLDCLYAEDDICKNFITCHDETGDQLLENLDHFSKADRFTENMKDNQWISMEDFLQGLP
jgi:hypothetical protein